MRFPWQGLHVLGARTLALSRGPAEPGRGQAQTPRRGPTGYPAILCDHGHGMPTAPAYGTGVRHAVPNSVPVLRDRWYSKEKSVMPAYTHLLFRGILRPVSRTIGPPATCACCSGSPTSTAPAGGGT